MQLFLFPHPLHIRRSPSPPSSFSRQPLQPSHLSFLITIMGTNLPSFKGRIPVKIPIARQSTPKGETAPVGSLSRGASKISATVRALSSPGSLVKEEHSHKHESPTTATPSSSASKISATVRAVSSPGALLKQDQPSKHEFPTTGIPSSSASKTPSKLPTMATSTKVSTPQSSRSIATARNFSRLPQRPYSRKAPVSIPLAQQPQTPQNSCPAPVDKPLPSPPPVDDTPVPEQHPVLRSSVVHEASPSVQKTGRDNVLAIQPADSSLEGTRDTDVNTDDPNWPLPNEPSRVASADVVNFRVKRLSMTSQALTGLGPVLKIDKQADAVLLGEEDTSPLLSPARNASPEEKKDGEDIQPGPAARSNGKRMVDDKPAAAVLPHMRPRVFTKSHLRSLAISARAGNSSETGSLVPTDKKLGLKKSIKTFFTKPLAPTTADAQPETPTQRLRRLELTQAVADCLEQVAEAKVAALRAEQMAKEAGLRCQRADLAMGRVVALVAGQQVREEEEEGKDGVKE
ncbi:uncharacterized protein EI97DRAFT_304490 [Westerdykella ornata]|uniref:Uncharacterized protein n=1 Tax=Westerdykella ornata TaxID=318751 RepID=A0A6A6JKG0_WESOR|nr:uncharacterized protein EI97DRAFT_304490 [Westerdykella ornata]KAF2276962.1 hypothetical protein EI97DRAFT_304490 [Westerdykella ornata]